MNDPRGDETRWPWTSVIFAVMLLVVGIVLTAHILLLPGEYIEGLDKKLTIVGGWIAAVVGWLGISFRLGGLWELFASRPVRACIAVLFCISLITLLPVGGLTVDSSPPGAAVRLDGESETRGTTPAPLSWLSIRPHSVQLSLDGYQPVNHKVPFGTVLFHRQIDVPLDRLSGTINVSTDPPGAAVFIDEDAEAHSPTPLEIQDIPAGPHRITIRMAGRKTVELTDVNVENDGVTEVHQKLPPEELPPEKYHRIQVFSIPPGAEIVVGEKGYGTTPNTIRLAEGEHLIEVRLDGKTEKKIVNLPQQTAVNFRFE
jgi:hypothetical protein